MSSHLLLSHSVSLFFSPLISLLFFFLLSAAHKLSWKGGAMRVTQRLRLLPPPPLCQSEEEHCFLEIQLLWIQSKTLLKHCFSCRPWEHTMRWLCSPNITANTNMYIQIQMYKDTHTSTKRKSTVDFWSHNKRVMLRDLQHFKNRRGWLRRLRGLASVMRIFFVLNYNNLIDTLKYHYKVDKH